MTIPWRVIDAEFRASWLRRSLFLGVAVVVTSSSAYQCRSDLDLGPVAAASQKGIALDDTTLWNCSSRIPTSWPNTQERVTSLRLFKAWDPSWPSGEREGVWNNVAQFARANGAKLLVGAQITCQEEDDDTAWVWTKQLLKILGPDHVMGLAVGNEMELLFQKTAVDITVTPECITDMWEGGLFFRQFVKRVDDFDALGFGHVAVTSVFGGLVLAGDNGRPFFEDSKAMVNTFLKNVTQKYGTRYVFTFNLYPYFDPSNALDPGTEDACEMALAKAACLDRASCSVPASTVAARVKMRLLTGSKHFGLWFGETGWSPDAWQGPPI